MKIAVIGAGASGLCAAVCAAEQGASVTVYEHMETAAKKLLMTGNGKCNLTNVSVDPSCYYTDSDEKGILPGVLMQFSPQDTVRWFERRGLLTRSKNGYVYPYCEQASAVRSMLLRNCKKQGVRIQYGTDLYRSLKQMPDGRFDAGGESYDRLILACGGKSARTTGSDGSGYELAKLFGHHVIPPKAALVQLHTDLPDWKLLAGVRAQGKARFHDAAEQGEIQFTEYGISGIPVFQISRQVVRRMEREQCCVSLDLIPEYTQEQMENIIIDYISQYKNEAIHDSLTGVVNEKILSYILHTLETPEHPTERKKMAYEIARRLKCFQVPVCGSHKLDSAQVTQGGIPLSEVDEGLQSVYTKGLFFAGEILDVDGKCGGYNLQWAWASGMLAAREAVK